MAKGTSFSPVSAGPSLCSCNSWGAQSLAFWAAYLEWRRWHIQCLRALDERCLLKIRRKATGILFSLLRAEPEIVHMSYIPYTSFEFWWCFVVGVGFFGFLFCFAFALGSTREAHLFDWLRFGPYLGFLGEQLRGSKDCSAATRDWPSLSSSLFPLLRLRIAPVK